MLTNEEKKKIEELTEAQYFDYLTEKKLNTKISEKFKYAIWIISSGLSIIITLGAILGINLKNNLLNSLDSLKTQMEEFDKKGNGIIDSLGHQYASFQMKLDDLNKKESFYNNQMGIMTANVQQVGNSAKDLFLERYELKSDLEENDKQMTFLNSLKKELEDKIAESNVLNKQVQSAISTKYMCVERGSLDKNAEDYREYTINLPDSDSTITVIFFDADFHKETVSDPSSEKSNERSYKQASIKIIIKNSDDKQTLEQTSIFLEQEKEIHIKDTRFYIEPLMIYLPPNSKGPLQWSNKPFKPFKCETPDFVFLRVFIKHDIVPEKVEIKLDRESKKEPTW